MKRILLLMVLPIVLLDFIGCTKNLDTESLHEPSTRSVLSDNDYELVTFPNNLVLKKRDSLYFFQGDMLLNDEQIEMLSAPLTRGGIRRNPARYWSNRTVYYKFSNDYTSVNQYDVEDIIQYYRDNTALKFIKLQPGQNVPNYIEFIKDGRNYSNIGMIGGRQVISLTLSGFWAKTVMHEIGHAIGLYHEHNRGDRNQFIKILWDNIDPIYWDDYKQYTTLGMDGRDIAPFDFNSVMLYPSFNNTAIDVTKPVMLKQRDNTTFDGGNATLTSGDKAGIMAMYGPPYPKLHTVRTKINQDYHDYACSIWDYEYTNTIVFYELIRII